MASHNGDLFVQSSRKLSGEKKRAPSMQRKLLGKSRTWASDGEYVYFRRKQANPATLQRHEQFLKTGNYRHIQTEDDVEIYQLQEGSAFKREPVNLAVLNYGDVRRQAIVAACRRDWGVFVDALEEMASRLKGAYHDGFAMQAYQEQLAHVFSMIAMRGGPSALETDREVAALRQRRGDRRNTLITLASLPPHMRSA